MQIKNIICLQLSGIAITVCQGGGSTIIIRTYNLPSHILSAVFLTPRLLSRILAILKESLQSFGIFPFNGRRIGFWSQGVVICIIRFKFSGEIAGNKPYDIGVVVRPSLQGDIIGQVIIGVHTEISSQVLSQINLIENEIFYYGKWTHSIRRHLSTHNLEISTSDWRVITASARSGDRYWLLKIDREIGRLPIQRKSLAYCGGKWLEPISRKLVQGIYSGENGEPPQCVKVTFIGNTH